MSGIVNSTGAVSGVIGTTVGAPTALGTVTAGTLGTGVTFPAGSAVQLETSYSNSDTSISTGTNNVWQDTGVTNTFTPRYNNSQVLIFITYQANLTNSSGDGGYGIRFKRAISGGATSYPAGASVQEGTANAHAVVYHGAVEGQYSESQCHVLLDTPGTTSAITYTMQAATYNAEALDIGGLYTSFWHLQLMEIKV